MRPSRTSRIRAAFANCHLYGHWLLFLAALLGAATATRAQSFLHTAGPKIVNAANQEVLLNSVNLGG